MKNKNDRKLFEAVCRGQTGTIRKYLELGANINARDRVSFNYVSFLFSHFERMMVVGVFFKVDVNDRVKIKEKTIVDFKY